MKSIIYGISFLALVGTFIVGCQKEQLVPQIKTSIVESDDPGLNKNAVVYANLSCTMENGESGCECVITQSDDDCSLQTPCTAQSTLPNYNNTLEALFTQEQILERARDRVRITEPELIEALKLDNFPLK